MACTRPHTGLAPRLVWSAVGGCPERSRRNLHTPHRNSQRRATKPCGEGILIRSEGNDPHSGCPLFRLRAGWGWRKLGSPAPRCFALCRGNSVSAVCQDCRSSRTGWPAARQRLSSKPIRLIHCPNVCFVVDEHAPRCQRLAVNLEHSDFLDLVFEHAHRGCRCQALGFFQHRA